MTLKGANLRNLSVFVDYDNIDLRHRAQGPVSLARMIFGLLPANLVHPYDALNFRLYGGWRASNLLTAAAQLLLPDIRENSPTVGSCTYIGTNKPLKIHVALAEGPLGTRTRFEQTLVRNRPLRYFRTNQVLWRDCSDSSNCGMAHLHTAHNATKCGNSGCFVQIGDVLVRDEQKMVDTLLVADVAYEAFVSAADEVVLVCSDADMWPGIFLALQKGCRITQIHSKPGWKTPKHLLGSLNHAMLQRYREISF